MRYLSFSDLAGRVRDEWVSEGSLFGIPKETVFKKAGNKKIQVFGETCSTPLGPAAGPHSQLSQNILASYLAGSRFIELKTVQKLDSLEIDKPCIDASDEGYNTEWSTELSLEQAWQEYTKAWIFLHLLRELLGDTPDGGFFVFNMSVGYDLEGIKTAPMDLYIQRMMDSSGEPLFMEWLSQMKELLSNEAYLNDFGRKPGDLSNTPEKIAANVSGRICNSVTLSTMHGCPPHEIEAICRYMLSDKKLNTYVKLNPTLLGYDWVRTTLDNLGYDYLPLKRESFEHDLQYDDALGILTRLRELATSENLSFGVKLTNTLGSVNDRDTLPGDEMYMSGRALFPMSINLAARLSRKFSGTLPISYSGGITAHNVEEVFRTGIRPVTVATDMLKPGGFLRMSELANMLEALDGWEDRDIDVDALEALADKALSEPAIMKDFRGTDKVSVPSALPLFECSVAPCELACPINQHIPSYIRLAGEGRYGEALALIYERNALPSITGHICDHQCQLHCTRMDYEGCVGIREVKRLAVLNGFNDFKKNFVKTSADNKPAVAVVGAGPAGLSTAYFLVREGFPVTVFERDSDAGGVVRNVVPHFRLSREAIESDVNFIKSLGVEFRFNTEPSVDELKAADFQMICLATGTYASRTFSIPGGEGRMMGSLEFLTLFNKDSSIIELGTSVAVMGAGDTAMDTARAAKRCPGVKDVTVIYRRSFSEMPASKEEYEDALAEGIGFKFLINPEEFPAAGSLKCRIMTLGEPDESGRRRPLPSDETVEVPADTLLYAIGDDPQQEVLKKFGLSPDSRGYVSTNDELETDVKNIFLAGDGRTGPSTIVKCISEGRKAADAICRRADPAWSRAEKEPSWPRELRRRELYLRKGKIINSLESDNTKPDVYFSNEAARCLECSFLCNKCVDVCPNRANISVTTTVESGFTQPSQVVHIDGYCNECGNCGTFCPWEGNPYRDKPTLFSSRDDFLNSDNPGWCLDGEILVYRVEGNVAETGFSGGKVAPSLKNDPGTAMFFELVEILYSTRPTLFAPMEV